MNLSYLILIILIIIVLIILFVKFGNKDMVYVKSDIDGEQYLVRDTHDKQQAANFLARIKENIMFITKNLYENKDKYKENEQYITQLKNKITNCIIVESSENSVYTSYSVNKGEQLVFCLRSRNNVGKLHDVNLLMYVVLHEISHIMCPEYGHTALFKKIFAFVTTEAIKLKLYNKIDFANVPTEYCGLTITDSII